eukprot:scaffold37387_cov51-Prasinocladus_malaysianus.AAC.2
MTAIDQTTAVDGQISNVHQFCLDLYGSATPPAGVPPGSVPNSATLVANCETCTNQFLACAQPAVPLLIGGILFVLATLLPCFFCCCCASPPSSSKYT